MPAPPNCFPSPAELRVLRAVPVAGNASCIEVHRTVEDQARRAGLPIPRRSTTPPRLHRLLEKGLVAVVIDRERTADRGGRPVRYWARHRRARLLLDFLESYYLGGGA